MFYTASPTADAERYEDYMDSLYQESERRRTEAAKEIRSAFENRSPVPYVTGSFDELRYMPWKDAVADMTCEKKVLEALLEVIRSSNCPKVETLRQVIVNTWMGRWADDVAEVM